MLSLPDLEQKQIITLSFDKELELKFSNDNLIIKKESKITKKVSLHRILAIYIIGNFTITSNLIEQTKSHGISLFLLKNNLEQYAAIEAFAEGNWLVRYRQYHLSDTEELQIGQSIVTAKILNQLKVTKPLITKTDYEMLKRKIKSQIKSVTTYQELLGIEGNFAKVYFGRIFANHEWSGRKPRAKYDINNLLLDIGYTYLLNYIDSILRLFGFDTYKGVYHKLFFQRKSLACDIMEPFRPIIDHALLRAWNLNQINTKDFDYRHPTFTLPWKNNKVYSKIFLEEIMRYKVDIYQYIRAYYRHIMSPEDNPMPDFKIKLR